MAIIRICTETGIAQLTQCKTLCARGDVLHSGQSPPTPATMRSHQDVPHPATVSHGEPPFPQVAFASIVTTEKRKHPNELTATCIPPLPVSDKICTPQILRLCPFPTDIVTKVIGEGCIEKRISLKKGEKDVLRKFLAILRL